MTKTIFYQGLWHYPVYAKVDGSPDGTDVLIVNFACPLSAIHRNRQLPLQAYTIITCVRCLTRWMQYEWAQREIKITWDHAFSEIR